LVGDIDIRPIGCAVNVEIDSGTFINKNLRLAAPNGAKVHIGENCAIGPNVSFETVSHNLLWTPEQNWGEREIDLCGR